MARGGQNNNNNNTNRFAPVSPASSSSVENPFPATMDSSNPLFLHNGDHPGMVLVSHVLTGPNYNNWSRAMTMALNAKNKLWFVDGSVPTLTTEYALYSSGSRCNSMPTSWILNSVSKDIADSLLYLDSARAVWVDLHDRFRQSNAPRIFKI